MRFHFPDSGQIPSSKCNRSHDTNIWVMSGTTGSASSPRTSTEDVTSMSKSSHHQECSVPPDQMENNVWSPSDGWSISCSLEAYSIRERNHAIWPDEKSECMSGAENFRDGSLKSSENNAGEASRDYQRSNKPKIPAEKANETPKSKLEDNISSGWMAQSTSRLKVVSTSTVESQHNWTLSDSPSGSVRMAQMPGSFPQDDSSFDDGWWNRSAGEPSVQNEDSSAWKWKQSDGYYSKYRPNNSVRPGLNQQRHHHSSQGDSPDIASAVNSFIADRKPASARRDPWITPENERKIKFNQNAWPCRNPGSACKSESNMTIPQTSQHWNGLDLWNGVKLKDDPESSSSAVLSPTPQRKHCHPKLDQRLSNEPFDRPPRMALGSDSGTALMDPSPPRTVRKLGALNSAHPKSSPVKSDLFTTSKSKWLLRPKSTSNTKYARDYSHQEKRNITKTSPGHSTKSRKPKYSGGKTKIDRGGKYSCPRRTSKCEPSANPSPEMALPKPQLTEEASSGRKGFWWEFVYACARMSRAEYYGNKSLWRQHPPKKG